MLAHVEPGSWTLLGWSLEPLLLGALLVALVAWALAVRRANRRHEAPVPASRTACFLAGVAALVVALASPIDAYADDLFSIHMLQHLLIAFVAAPLLVMSAPGTLALRASPGRLRRTFLVPLLRSRALRWLTFPLVTWLLFGSVMWLAHFTALFELALESQPIHDLEHVAFLVAGYLYWLPALGRDPMPWRLGISGRLLYLLLGMPVSSVLGLVIVAQTSVMYPHYLAPAALADQRLAGTVMWVGGDLISVVLIGLAVWAWVQDEARRARRRAVHAAAAAARGTR